MRRYTKVLAALSFVMVATIRCSGDRTLPPGPSTLLEDGNHGSGNPFFFWLSGLVNQQPPASQLFSGKLRPVVTITNLCSGTVIRALSGSQVQALEREFLANWATREDNLDPTCSYRITTKTGSRQLGIVDVMVVTPGVELKNVDSGESVALLDDGTLPIRFFIGVGSQCESAESDCGEGTAQPGTPTVIVTRNGQAGVSIPAGALDAPATIVIESIDQRPCVPGLLEPVFPGKPGPSENSCYDFHTDPPLYVVNSSGTFNKNVTVGICAQVGDLDHVTRDLLQIFQLHIGAPPPIRALNNVAAPFLPCDPAYTAPMGSRSSLLHELAAFFAPRPLFASTTTSLDVGTGGSTDLFSRFTWALPSLKDLDFDLLPDLSSILPGSLVNSAYSRWGITLSRTKPLSLLCPGTGVYANDYGLIGTVLGFRSGQNNVSPCPLGLASDFSDTWSGAIRANFEIPAVEACITATPTGYKGLFAPSGGVAYLEARDANGNFVSRTESTSQRVPQRLCVQGAAIASVRFAGKGSAYAIFDNLRWTRVKPTP